MKNKIVASLLLVIIITLFAGVTYAQEARGSIRGTVYQDLNGDGICVNTGEPILAGVPIQFVSGDTTVYLQSGDNGTYGLVAAGLGNWTVTAQPGTGWVVTSKNPLQAFLNADQQVILGVNFCVASSSTPIKIVLPESGSGVAPTLIAALLIGAGFIAAGAGLELRRRRVS